MLEVKLQMQYNS